MHLLRDRSDDLANAGIRPFGISRDSPWSHRAWAQTLGVEVPLLSDWNGDSTRAFDVAFEPLGMTDVPKRASFLIRDGATIEAAWMLGGEMPDLDDVIATAIQLSVCAGAGARGGGDRASRRANRRSSGSGAPLIGSRGPCDGNRYGTTTSFVPAPAA